jgi:hypothetical protein
MTLLWRFLADEEHARGPIPLNLVKYAAVLVILNEIRGMAVVGYSVFYLGPSFNGAVNAYADAIVRALA